MMERRKADQQLAALLAAGGIIACTLLYWVVQVLGVL
jgi:hypothetical protein